MEFISLYPVQYIKPVLLKDGTLVQLRPIHPIDGKKAHEFRAKLSIESIYDRFLGYIPKITPKLVQRLTQIDYSKEMAIVVEVENANEKEVIAVARIASEEKRATEFALIIADDWQGKGLGSLLTDYMIEISKDLGFEILYGYVFSHNSAMKHILQKRGFSFTKEDEQTFYIEKRV